MNETTGPEQKDRGTDATTVRGSHDGGDSSTKSDGDYSLLREIELEISELEAERDRVRQLLDDPLERKKRRFRRELHVGQMVAPTIRLSLDEIRQLREAYPKEAWLWDEVVLRADQWVLENGKWRIGRPRKRVVQNRSG